MLNRKMLMSTLRDNFNFLLRKINRVEDEIPKQIEKLSPIGENIIKLGTIPEFNSYDNLDFEGEYGLLPKYMKYIINEQGGGEYSIKKDGYEDIEKNADDSSSTLSLLLERDAYDYGLQVPEDLSDPDILRALKMKYEIFLTIGDDNQEYPVYIRQIGEYQYRGFAYNYEQEFDVYLKFNYNRINSCTVSGYTNNEVHVYLREIKLLDNKYLYPSIECENIQASSSIIMGYNNEIQLGDMDEHQTLIIGSNNVTRNYSSTIIGEGLIAEVENRLIIGDYNTISPNDIFVIGYGNYHNDRANIHTVNYKGEGWYKGNLYVGGDNKETSTRVATMKDIDAINEPRDYVVLKDQVTNNLYNIQMRDGVFNISQIAASVIVTKLPTKTIYADGDGVDLEGIVVEAIYPDGTRSIVDDNNIKAVTDVLRCGDTEITFVVIDSGQEIEGTFEVITNEFDPTVQLIDFYYADNGDGTYTITDWKGTLNGVTSNELIIPNNERISI